LERACTAVARTDDQSEAQSYCEVCTEIFLGVGPGTLHRCQEDQGGWRQTVEMAHRTNDFELGRLSDRQPGPALGELGTWLRGAVSLPRRARRQPVAGDRS
jgi:hypothetical protein